MAASGHYAATVRTPATGSTTTLCGHLSFQRCAHPFDRFQRLPCGSYGLDRSVAAELNAIAMAG